MDIDCEQIWKDCQTFKQLQSAMVLFLEGKCPTTIWYGAPVNDETIPLMSDLIEIVKRGFVTIEGQPGTILEKKIGIKSDFGKIGEKYTEKQRGYMSGYMLNALCDGFINKLRKSKKVFVYREKLNAIELFGTKPADIEEDRYITLTQEISKTKTENFTKLHIPNDTPGMVSLQLPMNPKLKRYLIQNCSYLTIATKSYGDTSLQQRVLKCI